MGCLDVVTAESEAFDSEAGTRNMIAVDITPVIVESLKAAGLIVPAILLYKSQRPSGAASGKRSNRKKPAAGTKPKSKIKEPKLFNSLNIIVLVW